MSSNFLVTKKGPTTFSLRLNEPSRKIIGPLSRYDQPWCKRTKKKQKKQASLIFRLAKNIKFPIFTDGSLKLLQQDFEYAESDGVIFIKIL